MENNNSTKVEVRRLKIDEDTLDDLIDNLYYGGDSAERFFDALERQFAKDEKNSNEEDEGKPKYKSTYRSASKPTPKPEPKPKPADSDIDDPVNHPAHYKSATGVECIDLIIDRLGLDIAIGFCLGNTFKYLYRCGAKGAPMQDVKKAHWYLSKFIELKQIYDSEKR